ncbi:MAG: 50S ribosomal protein L7/L12 [Clostridium sp.]|uniref:50S ribosomal protein L7/L12 n=1 Tax=Clostridium sp. TaxID=1506 RepID=UPI002909C69D|nr:50S ribosomal protein L7/L12 [Clostridium sp.]MDU4937652.1 50S ribosomal protein L7/L12 [Clostridium sp.]
MDYAIMGFLCGVSIVLMMNVSNQKDQIKILNNKLNKIINHLGIEDEELNKINDELNKLIIEGKKVKAVKLYRMTTGAGLKESKEYIDALADKLSVEQ